MFALFSMTGLSDGVPKKVAEVSVIWVLVCMFPLKIVHRTKQREESVWTSRTCFLLKYWPQRLLHKSLLRSLYKVKCLLCIRWNCYIQETFRVKTCKVSGWHFITMYIFFLFQFLPFNQNKMWKLLEFEKTCARREKSKLTLKTKHKISIANSYSYLVFAIICYFTITRKLTICWFLSRRAPEPLSLSLTK